MKNGKSLLVITSFPPIHTTHHEKIVGVASYTKNTLTSLSKDTDIAVLAEELSGIPQKEQKENITVFRVWKRNSFFLFLGLLQQTLFSFSKTKDIMIAVEVAMLGGKIQLALLPLFIGILRLFGKRVTIVMHQVITDIEELSGHIYTYTGITATVLNLLLKLYYQSMLFVASECIVMDEVLKKRLGNSKKIQVIAHGVEHFPKQESKVTARETLGIQKDAFVLLYFGFLAFYKGADRLVEAFAHIPKEKRNNVVLVMAGGPNPNHTDKPSYNAYIEKIKTIAKENTIVVTGFVPEERIGTYFAISDLVIFPYRTLMSASGPLSLALSFAKPFVISKEMTAICETKDMAKLLDESKETKQALIVDFDNDFATTLGTLTDPKAQTIRAAFSTALAKKRSWEILGQHYEATLLGK